MRPAKLAPLTCLAWMVLGVAAPHCARGWDDAGMADRVRPIMIAAAGSGLVAVR